MLLENIISRIISLESSNLLKESAGNIYLSYINLCDLANLEHLRFRRFLRAAQWYPVHKLRHYQYVRLKKILHHAYKNVPYYASVFKKNKLTPASFNSVVDLRKIPILTREDINKNLDHLVSRETDKKYLEPFNTSGSTGRPMKFYRDKRDEWIHAAFTRRGFGAVGFKGYHRNVFIWLAPFLHDGIRDGYRYEPHLKRLSIAPYPYTKDFWSEKVKLLKKFRPANICGSPAMLYDFAHYLSDTNIGEFRFNCLISGFDNLFPRQRDFIEKQLRCDVYAYYASYERIISAFECREKKGMHIDMERGILEILDEKGEPVPRGGTGRVVVTGLQAFSMPFIRYDIGDLASVSKTQCACGRGLPLLFLQGRASEVIRHKNKIIYDSALSAFMCRFENIKECQFVQENENELKLNIVTRDRFDNNYQSLLLAELNKLIGPGISIKICVLEKIPRLETGKFQFVLNKMQAKPDRRA